jgi:trafficking protein particle complex subunit 10
MLSENNISDWMIVLVETYDIRKTNKLLPRTTVLDKIRNDFASKNGDRCLSVINPVKSESRSAESWRGLVTRIRHLVLTSYNKTLIKFEDHMREQRDKRNEPGWNFSDYFLLQEQLAFVLEMLGLFDEALIQYDELDALFTQFILNSTVGEFPKWLSSFQKPVEMWHGISLSVNIPHKYRDLIKNCNATLIDFRTYLFQRQSAMLLSTSKPWEVNLNFVSNQLK